MKKILLGLFTLSVLLLAACETVFNGPVLIRVENAYDQDFNTVFVSPNTYGTVMAGEKSEYKEFEETARALLTPGEVMQLPADQELILLSGKRPIKAQKIKYYEDRNFTERCMEAPDYMSGRAETTANYWTSSRASIHTNLVLDHAKYKQDLAARTSHAHKTRPLSPDPDAPDLETNQGNDDQSPTDQAPDKFNQRAVRNAHNFDQANDIGMLGPSNSFDDGSPQ